MSLISYGKCNGCGRFDMLNLFWYSMVSTAPIPFYLELIYIVLSVKMKMMQTLHNM